jgi:putative intracellular protease/amidase
MKGKKILMLAGEFSEEYEIFVFEQAMTAVGHAVDVVCPGRKAGDCPAGRSEPRRLPWWSRTGPIGRSPTKGQCYLLR